MTPAYMRCKREFELFMSEPHNVEYLESEEFERRQLILNQRLDSDGQLNVYMAAELLGLPVDVFRFLFAQYLVDSMIAVSSHMTRH